MDNLYQLMARSFEQGQSAALATIVQTQGSTPRRVGSKMLIYANGRTVGTVGGGKMEFLTIQAAVEAIRQDESRLLHFDLTGEEAESPEVGICGGGADVFVDVLAAPPTLLVVGGGHVAQPMAEIGAMCGFRVVVLDDRADMVSAERFPHAAERISGDIVETLSHITITANTWIVIVTRGHAHDQDALRAVLASPAAYVGMIGSRSKVQTVLGQLQAEGIDPARLAQVRAPIGLNLGGQTPAEIAVSIMAEILMLRYGRDGKPMKLYNSGE